MEKDEAQFMEKLKKVHQYYTINLATIVLDETDRKTLDTIFARAAQNAEGDELEEFAVFIGGFKMQVESCIEANRKKFSNNLENLFKIYDNDIKQ